MFFTKNISKVITKNLIGKYTQERLDHAKLSGTDDLSKAIQKIVETTIDLIDNKTANAVVKSYDDKNYKYCITK